MDQMTALYAEASAQIEKLEYANSSTRCTRKPIMTEKCPIRRSDRGPMCNSLIESIDLYEVPSSRRPSRRISGQGSPEKLAFVSKPDLF